MNCNLLQYWRVTTAALARGVLSTGGHSASLAAKATESVGLTLLFTRDWSVSEAAWAAPSVGARVHIVHHEANL